MNGDYLSLAGRIEQDLRDLKRVVHRIERTWEQASRYSDDVYIDAVALNLHGFYAGVEHIFEAIATQVDKSLPQGNRWHIEILYQMASPIPKVRPAVISTELRDELNKYRGFRHVVRNVYTFNLDPALIQILVENLPDVSEQLEKELLAFARWLENSGGNGG